MSDLKDLLAQRDELDVQLEAAFQEEKGNVSGEIVRKMKLHGISFEEVREPVKVTAGKVAPTSRDPVTGTTWTGRGSALGLHPGRTREQQTPDPAIALS